MATEGGDPPAVDAPRASDGPAHPDAPEQSHAGDRTDDDVVITTVVYADENRPPPSPDDERGAPPEGDADDLAWIWADGDDADDAVLRPAETQAQAPPVPTAPELESPVESPAPPRAPSTLEHRMAALEGLPATVDTLGKAIRHELERCAGVLFGHDRALGALASRLDAAEAAAATTGDPTTDALLERARMAEETVVRVLEQVERMDLRLVAMESRVEPLEPLPTIVQALRRAVRASDDVLAGETAAREQALVALAGQQAAEAQSREDALRRLVAQDLDRVTGITSAQAKGLSDLAERLAAAEGRLGPLDSVPEDIAALSRILRRELDAIVTDNQARDQMLRRALQNEIDQLRATSEAREELAQALAGRLDALEHRSADATTASEAAHATAATRLETLESRIGVVDRISAEVDALSDTVRRELEHLRAGGQAHDQVAGELTRRLSALDARLARLDPLPGEMQSVRTAMLQESERTIGSLRAAEERIGQLAWVPGEFQEARKRIMTLTSGVQSGQDRVAQLEAALVSVNERLDSLRARLVASTTPGPIG